MAGSPPPKYFVYILLSGSTARHYCGSTDDIDRRLRQHNDPEYIGTKTTKRFEGPWELASSEAFETRGSAMIRERQIKKRGIARFLADQDRRPKQ